MITASGPMFEPSKTDFWESSFKQSGAHYNIFRCVNEHENGMAGLRQMFPEGEANELNFVLFSTSGVHGMYTTIEEAERLRLNGGKTEDSEPGDEPYFPDVTFLIIHPRIVCMRYGNCSPVTPEDFAFLKQLRQSSILAIAKIGMPDAEPTQQQPEAKGE